MNKNYVDYRSFLMANVDVMLQTASSLRQVSSIESDDLFGNEEDSSKTKIEWQNATSNLSIFDVLLKEKDSLGLFVSGNPLNEYAHVQDWVRENAARDDIFLVLITKVKKIFTKAGQMMLALQITLDTGEVEGVIFPKRAMDLSPKLVENEMFWVRGKISLPKKRDLKPEVIPSLVEESDLNENSESSDITEEAIPTEIVERVKEYDELPKLLIDNLCIFEEGPLAVLANEDIRISINREKLLNSKDWKQLKQNPISFYHQPEAEQNLKAVDIQTVAVSDTIKTIKITKQMGPETLLKIKTMLCKYPGPNLVEIELWVENMGKMRRVKDKYWLPVGQLENFK